MRYRAQLMAAAASLQFAVLAGGQHALAQAPNATPTVVPAKAPQAAAAAAFGFADAVAKALPSVVHLSAAESFPSRPRRSAIADLLAEPPSGDTSLLGSGFVVGDGTVVVTTLTAIGDAEDVRATLADGRTVDAVVVGRDSAKNLAFLRLEEGELPPALILAETGAPMIGDFAVAVGRPTKEAPRVALGIIATEPDEVIRFDGDARGLVGGPILSGSGAVIGVTALVRSPLGEQIAVAIPADAVRDDLAQLREVRAGADPSATLGIRLQSVSPAIARAIGLDAAYGALVTEVEPGQAGDKAGIKPGDVITGIDGVDLDDPRDVMAFVGSRESSKPMTAEIWRDRKAMSLDVPLAAAKESSPSTSGTSTTSTTSAAAPTAMAVPPGGKDQPDLGVVLGGLTADLRTELRLSKDASGVVILGIRENSVAARNGLRPGDVIVEVAGTPVSDPAKLTELIAENVKMGSSGLMVRVNRQGRFGYVVLPV